MQTLLTALGALIAGLGGLYITIHEVRRRERRVTRKEIHDLMDEVEALRQLLLEQRRYVYRIVSTLIDHGIDTPPPPAPSFDPGEYDE